MVMFQQLMSETYLGIIITILIHHLIRCVCWIYIFIHIVKSHIIILMPTSQTHMCFNRFMRKRCAKWGNKASSSRKSSFSSHRTTRNRKEIFCCKGNAFEMCVISCPPGKSIVIIINKDGRSWKQPDNLIAKRFKRTFSYFNRRYKAMHWYTLCSSFLFMMFWYRTNWWGVCECDIVKYVFLNLLFSDIIFNICKFEPWINRYRKIRQCAI